MSGPEQESIAQQIQFYKQQFLEQANDVSGKIGERVARRFPIIPESLYLFSYSPIEHDKKYDISWEKLDPDRREIHISLRREERSGSPYKSVTLTKRGAQLENVSIQHYISAEHYVDVGMGQIEEVDQPEEILTLNYSSETHWDNSISDQDMLRMLRDGVDILNGLESSKAFRRVAARTRTKRS